MALCLGCGLQVDTDGYPAVHVAQPLICDNTTGVGVKLGDRMFVDGATGALGYHDPVRVTSQTQYKVLNLGEAAQVPAPNGISLITGWTNLVALQNPFPGTAKCTISWFADMACMLQNPGAYVDPSIHNGELQLVYSVDAQATTIAVPGVFNNARVTRLSVLGTYQGYSSGNWPLTFTFPVGYYQNLDFYLRWYSPTGDTALTTIYMVGAKIDWVWEQAL